MFKILNILLLGFINPTIKLNSGKKIKLSGSGPPLLFSTGLFGTMPDFLYSNFLSKLKKDFTIITLDSFHPIVKNDIDDIVNSISVNSIAYLSHSSFNYDVIESNKINNAILIDPICIPAISFNGLISRDISINCKTIIIKASKLYNSKLSLPDWQNPNIQGNTETIIYDNVGHPDILNNFWANLAKDYGFWDSTQGKILDFKNWTLKGNKINHEREKYRNYIANKTINLIL